MRGSKILLLVVGVLFVLVGLGLGAGGVVSGLAHFARDTEGYLSTPPFSLETDGYALTAEHVELVATPGDWAPWSDRLELRMRITPEDPGTAVFAGIAPRADVQAYLGGVAHDEVAEFTPGARYRTRSGDEVPTTPGDEAFWVASVEGTGTQTLRWTAESGRWAVVVMNADAAPGVAVAADAGAQLSSLGVAAVVLALGALAFVAAGAAMIIAAVPDDHTMPPGAVGAWSASGEPARAHPVAVVGRLDAEVSRWQWLVKWVLLIPHVIVLAALWVAFVALTVVAWFAIVFTGRYPPRIFTFNVGVLRWTWRVGFYGYSALGTDRYPPFNLDDVAYPARLDVAYPQRLSRGLALIKSWLLALPHLVIVAVFTGGAATWTYQLSADDSWQISLGGGLIGLLVLVAGIALLFTGRYPAGLFDLVVGLNRWVLRVVAYVALMTDDYPPFRLDMGGEEPPSGQPPPPRPTGHVSGDSRPVPV